MQSEPRVCQNCKKEFTIESDDFGFYEKIKVPPPTFCPNCRAQRRNAWRNTFTLYSRKCDLCAKSVISLYAPDSEIIVYCNKCWWSDKWDPKSYAQDYDFSKPFFAQFIDFVKKVPHISVVNDNGIASLNCEYTHDWWFSKNCYMAFSGWYVENVMYSYFITAGRNIMDTMINMAESEYLYECINCSHGYNVKYSQYAGACIDSQFLYDCRDCSNCFMSFGLRNKKYFFKNQQYTKGEYEKILNSYKLETFSGVKKAQEEFDKLILNYPRRYAWHKQNKDCSGDVISYSKNTKNCFIAKRCENCRYSEYPTKDKDCYDITMTGETSECYEGVVVDHSQLNFFGIFSVKSQDIRYTQHCHFSKHLFGCVALRSNSYCIFNKQYTKEEYDTLVRKIIEQMNEMPYVDKNGCEYRYGEFYPIELSLFGYNETLACEQILLSKEEALNKGYKWQDNLQRTTKKETLLPQNIPDSIKDISDNVIQEILSCVECKRNYKIVQNELIFYKKMQISIPRKCFYCRHANRIKHTNPFKLWHRSCMCDKTNHGHEGNCLNEFETSYAPERPEIVYCEKCYQQEIY